MGAALIGQYVIAWSIAGSNIPPSNPDQPPEVMRYA